jgi:ribosomal protein S18 acetylase RimI-like enzyme
VKHKLPVKIRPMTAEDFGHIVVTWCKSYKTSDFAEEIKFDTYMDHHKDLVQKAVETGEGAVLCLEDDETLIIAYIVYELHEQHSVVHYVHTKPKFRRFGFASQLIDHIAHKNFTITHKTKRTKYLKRKNFNYNPYLFFERKEK